MHSLEREKRIIFKGNEQECKKELRRMQMENPQEASKFICSNYKPVKESDDNFGQLSF